MNQITNHTEQQIEVINPMAVMGTVKSIVPRSFEKTFSGLTTEQISYSFKICLDGLTRDQIQFGMTQVRDNGFCPDPAMFRKWCLGIKGFNNENPIESSYKGKYAALNDIHTWLSKDKSTSITKASFLAYEKSIEAFNDLKWVSNYERAKRVADSVFMENYEEVVCDLVQQEIKQEMYVPPVCIEKKVEAPKVLTAEEQKQAEEMKEKYLAQLRGLIKR